MTVARFLLLVFLLFSCTKSNSGELLVTEKNHISVPLFQALIDSAQVKGSILFYHLETNTYYSNDFKWAKVGQLPASTFKIPNSIIALETGIVENEQTMFEWDGEERFLDIWEQDLAFKDAFRYSCVPCYQEIAREIGVPLMRNQLLALGYNGMQFDSASIDLFWLQGESQITQFQQVAFLRRFHQSELEITDRTERIMKSIMIIESNQDYTLRGKTGWSIDGETNNGWYVGYVEQEQTTYFFATNIEPLVSTEMNNFARTRIDITHQAFTYFDLPLPR